MDWSVRMPLLCAMHRPLPSNRILHPILIWACPVKTVSIFLTLKAICRAGPGQCVAKTFITAPISLGKVYLLALANLWSPCAVCDSRQYDISWQA
jgi:hypothetical protein